MIDRLMTVSDDYMQVRSFKGVICCLHRGLLKQIYEQKVE